MKLIKVINFVYQDWMPSYFKELASFSKDQLPSHFESRNVLPFYENEIIETLTIASIIDMSRFNHIDAYFIDVEGFDYEIIKLIDFES